MKARAAKLAAGPSSHGLLAAYGVNNQINT